MDALYVGIDGGGTKTKCIIVDASCNELGVGFGGPSNPNRQGGPRAVDSIVAAVLDAIRDGRDKGNLHGFVLHFERMLLGISGAAGPRGREILAKEFAVRREAGSSTKLPFTYGSFRIVGDIHTAWYAAFEGEPGIIFIAGTGCAVYGRIRLQEVPDEQTYCLFTSPKTPEYSFTRSGDGGFSVGRSGIIACANALRNPSDILVGLMRDAYASGKLWADHRARGEDFSRIVMRSAGILFSTSAIEGQSLSHTEIAAVAFYVSEASLRFHAASRDILSQTSLYLYEAIESILAILPFPNGVVPVAYFGSVFGSPLLYARLWRELPHLHRPAKLVLPKHSIEHGAALMAIRDIDVPEHVVSIK